MKKILLIPIFLLLFSCTPDEAEPVDQPCGKISVRGWTCCGVGYYFKVNGNDILVSESVYNRYQLGDAYCK